MSPPTGISKTGDWMDPFAGNVINVSFVQLLIAFQTILFLIGNIWNEITVWRPKSCKIWLFSYLRHFRRCFWSNLREVKSIFGDNQCKLKVNSFYFYVLLFTFAIWRDLTDQVFIVDFIGQDKISEMNTNQIHEPNYIHICKYSKTLKNAQNWWRF